MAILVQDELRKNSEGKIEHVKEIQGKAADMETAAEDFAPVGEHSSFFAEDTGEVKFYRNGEWKGIGED